MVGGNDFSKLRRDDEIGQNNEIGDKERSQMLRAKKCKSIHDVLEEVEVLIDTHFFNEFWETKSSQFLKKVIDNQGLIEMNTLKRTWMSLNCSLKTMKLILEIQENLLCVVKRREMITKKKAETVYWCSKSGTQLNARQCELSQER